MNRLKKRLIRIESTLLAVLMTASLFCNDVYAAQIQDYSQTSENSGVVFEQISDSDVLDESTSDDGKVAIADENGNLGETEVSDDIGESDETILPDAELEEESSIEEDSLVDADVVDDDADIDNNDSESEDQEVLGDEDELLADTEDVSEELMMYVDEPGRLIQEGGFDICEEEALGASVEAVQSKIYSGLKKKSSSIDISSYGVSTGKIEAIYYGVVNEHPDLYYAATAYKYWYNYSGIVTKVEPVYISKYDDEAFNRAVDKAMSVVQPWMSDWEKAIALHDYIVQNTKYNKTVGNGGSLSTPNAVYTAYGVFVNQDAVCQGYALAYKLLLNKVGIECGVVISNGEHHEWNYICIDGEYYYVDVTWDDPYNPTNRGGFGDVTGQVLHKHMFLSQSTMSTFHKYGDWQITRNGMATSYTKITTSSDCDEAYWRSIDSPFIWNNDGTAYFLYGGSRSQQYIYKADLFLNNCEDIVYVGNNVYGFFELADMLYVALNNGLYRVDKEGNAEFVVLPTDPQYPNGIALNGCGLCYNVSNDMDYVILQSGTKLFTYRLGAIAGLNEYTVRFYDAKGNMLREQYILDGRSASAPKVTAPKGYEAAWDEDFSEVHSDMDIMLNYKPIRYTITYNLVKEAAVNSELNPNEYDITKAVNFAAPTCYGYKFGGWFTSSKYTSTSECNKFAAGKTGNLILYAKWSPIAPKAPVIDIDGPRFVTEDGKVLVDAGTDVIITGEENSDIRYTVDGTKPTIKSSLYGEAFKADHSMVVKAVGVRDTLVGTSVATLKIEVANNDLEIECKDSVVEGKTKQITVSKIPSTRSEQEIVWTSSDEAVATIDENGVVTGIYEGTTTITATVNDWLEREVVASIDVNVVPDTYYVSFLGFNGKLIEKQGVLGRHAANAPAMDEYAPKGYSFDKWDDEYDYITEDKTIKALFVPEEYTITYNTAYGSVTDEKYTKYTVETEELVLPKLEEDGLIFAGWYENEQYTGLPMTTLSSARTGDITLFAKWITNKTLWILWDSSVQLDENGYATMEYTGKGQKPAFTVFYGDKELKSSKDYAFKFTNNVAANEDISSKYVPTLTITGKGNYAGKQSVNFFIRPKSIEDVDVDILPLSLAYNKKTQKPLPTVTWNGKKLGSKDLQCTYVSEEEGAYREEGNYKVLVEGRGNYTGSKTIDLDIWKTSSSDKTAPVVMKSCKASISAFTYDYVVGENETGYVDFDDEKFYSHVKVTYGKTTLSYTADIDEDGYGVELISAYTNPIKDVGTYTAKVVGHGKYQGEIRASFKITGKEIKSTVIGSIPSVVYDGNAIEPELNIATKAGVPLYKDKDYTVTFSKNTDVGTATATIKGINSYCGTVKKTFKIVQKVVPSGEWAAENINISFVDAIGESTFEYVKGGVTPKLKVTYTYYDEGREDFVQVLLKEKVDYSLSYKNNTTTVPTPGKDPYVTVTLKKNMKGSAKMYFNVIPKDISKCKIVVKDIQENTKAGKYMSVPTIYDVNGKKLTKGDFEAVYEYRDADTNILLDKYSKPKAGDAIYVTVRGKKNYDSSTTVTGKFRVYAKGTSISSATIKVKPEVLAEMRYNGEPIMLKKSDLIVTMGKNVVLNPEDFEILENTYINNTNKGTAKVSIAGKGKYAGIKTISYSIKPWSLVWWDNK